MVFDDFLVKSSVIPRFVMNFRLVLEAQTELDKKFGHFKYLLLEIRRFPGSLDFYLPGSSVVPLVGVGRI